MKKSLILIGAIVALMMSGCGDNDAITREECKNEGNKIVADFYGKKISVDTANQLLAKHKEKCAGLSRLSKKDKFKEEKHEVGTPMYRDLP